MHQELGGQPSPSCVPDHRLAKPAEKAENQRLASLSVGGTMTIYTAPIRDMQFVLHDVLNLCAGSSGL